MRMNPAPTSSSPALLRRLEQRLRRARPGSVLILVVALLVLLALLGTAFINVSGTDRYSSAQNSFNVEVDLLLQGVVNIVEGAAVDGLFNGNTFSQVAPVIPPNAGTSPNSTYSLNDYPGNAQSAFLADRYPVPFDTTAGAISLSSPISPTGPSPTVFPCWRFISSLPGVSTFESPYVASSSSPATYTSRQSMVPGYLQISLTSGGRVNYPALIDTSTNPNTKFLAADADGDGIADAGLFRLPVGQINGVTYFGAARVVDNSAAVNAAIAWQPNNAPQLGTVPGNLFPTNVDLFDLLLPGDQAANFANFNQNVRFAGISTGPSQTPVDDRPTAPVAPPTPPPPPPPSVRADFTFGTPFEAFWMQVGRRITSPGYNYNGTNPVRYVATPSSETQRMARRFIIRDSSSSSAAASSSILEQNLPTSVYNAPNPTSPYGADQSLQWGLDNFDYAKPAGIVPARSMLVTQNPVSNFSASKLNGKGAYAAGTYNFGDWVLASDNRVYVCLQPQTATAPDPANPHNGIWEQEPWTSSPLKTSANTATFGQLWLAYFSAMSDLPAPGGFNASNKAATNMFRSSIRTVAAGVTGWTNVQQLQLRAAIAAINTLQLRATNTANVLFQNIVIADPNGAPTFRVTVYGTAPQPYITEVYANNNTGGPAGYMAIELHNPYPTPMPLLNWQLATVARTVPSTGLVVTPVPTTVTTWAVAATAPTIPPNGYIVLASSDPAPAPFDTAPNAPVATVAAGTLFVVPELATTGFNNEVMLLRPAGTAGDMMPVDSYDFTGLSATEGPPGHDWHYIRPNDVTQKKAWHHVYPGFYPNVNSTVAAYQPAAAATTAPRQAGTQVGTAPPNQVTTLATLGAADADIVATPAPSPYPYIDRPLQVNNADFGGPKTVAHQPFGEFARNGDLLQVTYVGAYRISTGTSLLEINPVTMDSSQADEPALSQDANAVASEKFGRENVGRFCPIHWADTVTAAGVPVQSTELNADAMGNAFPDDFAAAIFTPGSAGPPATAATLSPNPLWTSYQWTQRLFDYITIQAPHDDYLPDVDPVNYSAATAVANNSYLVANAGTDNYPSTATEEAVPVHGRININTANWRVLATLPMFDGVQYPTPGPANAAYYANVQLAQAIVYYRDIDDQTGATPHPHGAFQSMYELNNVTIPLALAAGPSPATSPTQPLPAGTSLRSAFGARTSGNFIVSGTHASNFEGDFSPLSTTDYNTAGADLVYGDFENQNIAITRISNLITTRSDSFTAYVMVQGWQNVGTNKPQLVVQRRAAFLIDRSGVTPLNRSPSVVNVPVN